MKHFYLTLFFIVSFFSVASAQDKFIFRVETTTNNESFTIPTASGETYLYDIFWREAGNFIIGADVNITGDFTITFNNIGIHRVEISPSTVNPLTSFFPRIYFNNSGDKDKIVSIEQWGSNQWTSMENAFHGCTNLTINASDTPDLSLITNMSSMFEGTTNLEDQKDKIGDWNVSTIENMTAVFKSSGFDENINNWNVSNVRFMDSMFEEAFNFNQPLNNWTTTKLEFANAVFKRAPKFNQNLSNWNMSLVQEVGQMFFSATGFDQSLASWDISSMTDMNSFLLDSRLSIANYDATIKGWATLEPGETQIPTGISFHGGTSAYCYSVLEHNQLESVTYNWTIIDAGSSCDLSNPFITTWRTTTANESITIPTTDSGYDYFVDWGDGNFSYDQTGDATHIYALAGTYTVKIIDDFPQIYFNNSGDKNKMRTIEQWGNIQWTSMENAFYGCERLKLNATDAPNLSGVTSLSQMFRFCRIFEDTADMMNSWDVSRITDMSGMFRSILLFNENIGNWNVGSVTDFSEMFYSATTFNQNISNWNIGEFVSGTINMTSMFHFADNFNQPLNNWVVSKVDTMKEMFFHAYRFNQPLNNWDVSNVTNMEGMFENANRFDQNLSDWDISSVGTMNRMFNEETKLSISNYDKTLIGWATLDTGAGETQIPNGVRFSAISTGLNDFSRKYCLGESARNTLISQYNWRITDGGSNCSDDFFITTWQTTSANESIIIPTSGTGYDYTVDWGDGSIESGFTGNATHTYATPGIKTIKILGDFPRIYFNNSGDKNKIISIEQWGTQQWTSMQDAFNGCVNLILNADDTPDLSQATSMVSMFERTTNLSDEKDVIGTWDVRTIRSMKSLFERSSFNENINNWNVTSLTDITFIFRFNRQFNQPLNGWDEAPLTDIFGAFIDAHAFNQDVSTWDVSRVSDFSALFFDAQNFNQDLSTWDISSASLMETMLLNTALSAENYDKTLIGWAKLDAGETQIPDNVSFANGTSSTFCAGAAARTQLEQNHSWVISDGGLSCAEEDKFITIWETTSTNQQIQIPTTGIGYSYDIDWGDGTIETRIGGSPTHIYVTAGRYEVKIAGAFPRIRFNNLPGNNKLLIQEIKQWGSIAWSSMEDAFNGCANLIITATDQPDLSQTISMQEMFRSASSLVDNGGQVQNWDVSTIQNFTSTFERASMFDVNLGAWDIRSAVLMGRMLGNSGLSTVNYDATLTGWAANSNTPDNQNFGAANVTYCFAEAARNVLDVDKSWAINDAGSDCNAAFITTWQTTTANETITIPTIGSGYDYTVDWGDGTIEGGFTGNATHTYTGTGSHNIKIIGDFPRIYFNNTGDKDNIISIDQWGAQQWTSMSSAFYGCERLVLNAEDIPDLSLVTDVSQMFRSARSFIDTKDKMETWNVSRVTNMSNMFREASDFNENIGSWDVRNVANFSFMFSTTNFFNQNLNNWDIGENVVGTVSMHGMFDSTRAFNQPLNNWDVSKVTNMSGMFGVTENFNQPIDTWDTSNVANMGGMFFGAKKFDQNIGSWNLSSVSNMAAMFQQSNLSQENYDAILIGWATQDVGEIIPSNISISFEGSTYCLGIDARNKLTDPSGFNWSIDDDGTTCASTDFFVTTWQTTVANESITIPTTGIGYDYIVDWGDGTIEIGLIGNVTHEYVNAGTYTVKINGDFPRIFFNDGGDKNKIQTIEQWGTIAWQSMAQAFNGCSNLKLNATDTPDLSLVTNSTRMFARTSNLEDLQNTIGLWDTGNIENMNTMFFRSGFNEDIGSWDVSQVKDFDGMFYQNNNFNQDLGAWDISEATTMRTFIANTNFSLENYDKTLIGWATLDSGETRIPQDVVLSVDLTKYCEAFLKRDQLLKDYNWRISDSGLRCPENEKFITTWQTTTPNETVTIPSFSGESYSYVIEWGDNTTEVVTTDVAPSHTYINARTYTVKIIGNFPRIYFNDVGDKTKIKSIEQWGVQQWVSMEEAFKGCSNIVINAADTPDLSLATSLSGMFQDVTRFADNGGNIGNWNVSTIQTMDRMFQNSSFEENINNWNVSQVKSINNMFQGCEDFNQPLDQWDTRNLESAREVFTDTKSFDQSLGAWDISVMTNMTNILSSGTLSTANYDSTLIGWATDTSGNSTDGIDDVPANIALSVGSSTYCLGLEARNTLTNAPYNWTINDGGTICLATDAFITTWQTTSANESITIPTAGSSTYNYAVDWGDGTVESGVTGNVTHQYTTAGTYTVKISGDFPRIVFGALSDVDSAKIQTVEQWGNQQWVDMSNAFIDCFNLKLNADDVPDLTLVTSLYRTFSGCTNLEDLKDTIGTWNLESVTTISDLFADTSFNENINSWNVSKVDNFSSMFKNNTAFNQPLNNWNTEKANDLANMFDGATAFNQPIGMWNVALAETFDFMFLNATTFDQNLAAWDISNTSRDSMDDMLAGSGISQTNYDATLIGWATLEVGETRIPTDVKLDASATYCLAEAARNRLTSAPYNWTISDGGQSCDFTDAFNTTWQTTVANETVTIPTTDGGYNYVVNWGDGTIETGFTGNATHTYTTAGVHVIKIVGDFPRIYFNNSGDKDKIIAITQWGNQQWTSMEAAFYGCTNVIVDADDTPDLTNVTSLHAMFKGATNLIDTEGSVANWDVRTIVDLSQLFMDAEKINTSLSSWRFNVAEDLSEMFRGAKAFNQPIGTPSQAKTLEGMFRDATAFNQPVNWYIPFVTNLKDMFNGATSFDQNLGYLTIPLVTTMEGMFTNAGLSTENYDQTLSGWFVELNAQDTRPNNITFNAGSSQYCMAGDIIAQLENDYGWSITDSGASCDENDFFIMTWDLTTETSFVMPTSGDGYDYLLSFSNGNIYHMTNGALQVGYPENIGMFTVRIYGDFPRFDFDAPFVNKEKLIAIEQWGSLRLSEATGAFAGCTNLKLNAADTPDLSGVTSTVNMFKNCTNLEDSQDKMGDWNMSTITNISNMFESCTTFNENIGNWDTSRIFFMDATFSSATSFNQDISDWDTSNVAFFRNTFNGATSFDQSVGDWDISGVQFFMSDMFINSGMSQASYDDTLIGWATLSADETKIPNNVRFDINATYCLGKDARNILTSAPNNWTINDDGFRECDFSGAFVFTWQTTTNNEMMIIPTSSSAVYDYTVDWGDGTIEGGFTGDATHTYATAGVQTIKVTGQFPRIFFFGSDIREQLLTIEQWGTQQWDTMQNAFNGCTNLKLNADDTPDLSQVTSMSSMFRDCTNLEDLKDTINSWGMTTVESISSMFKECTIFDENIGGWTFDNLTSAYNAFESAAAFNQDISNWNVSKVDQFDAMFKDATSFNQPIGNWTLGVVDYIDRMFQGATAFNQDLSNWDFSNVYEAGNMFDGASSFNQDLSSWDISNVETLDNFFTGTAMSTENYDKTLIGWATLEAGETRIPVDLTLNADAMYCLAEAARNTLISAPYNWTINDGGAGCPNPEITLLGDNPQTIVQGDPYTELGATVTYGATLIINASGVNTNQLGEYTVTYNASTPSGANAVEVIRTVKVVEPCPLISLPANNFSITGLNETCVDSNDGMINITAATALEYTTTINGADYNFTSTLTIDNLAPGTYSVCIGVNGFTDCEKCFEAVIDDTENLTGTTEVITEAGNSKVNVTIATGTAPYTVKVNNEILETYDTKSFSVAVTHGDQVTVSSSIDCEGELTINVNLINEFILAPNPARDHVIISAPNTGLNNLQVSLYNAIGVHIFSGIYTLNASKVIVPMSSLSQGVYFITINGGKVFKIIKE